MSDILDQMRVTLGGATELRLFIESWMRYLESGKYGANKRVEYEKRIEEYSDLYITLFTAVRKVNQV